MLIGTQMSEIGDRRWLLDVNQLNHPIGKKSGAIYRTQVGNSYMRALPPPLFYPVFYIVDELPCSPHSHFCQPSGTPKRCSYLHPQKPEIMTETLTTSSTKGTAGFSPDARWATGASFIFEKAASKETAGSITMAVPSDDYDSDEPSPNTTKLLLESHTSTDGSESPKPRWTRGPPPTLKEEPSASTIRSASGEKDAPPSPPTLRSGRAGTSPSGVKSYVAWTWLLEDEGTSEPKLRKPGDGEAVALPQLMDAERELLYQNTRQRLLEVGRQSPDVSALIEEYLRFAYLRERLDGLLTLEPSALVDDAWHAHTASGREYAAFCERTFGEQQLKSGILHRNKTPLSHPVLYRNTVEAYEYFFDTCPPADSWPAVQPAGTDPKLKDEEAAVKVHSRCRRKALVRSA